MTASSGSGHRVLPHTADVIVEAWAPTREGCFEETARALVGAFADVTGAAAVDEVTFAAEGSDADLLVALLEEIVYVAEVRAVVPVDVRVVAGEGGAGIRATFAVVPAASVVPTGALPKGVSRSDLVVTCERGRWLCRATVDV